MLAYKLELRQVTFYQFYVFVDIHQLQKDHNSQLESILELNPKHHAYYVFGKKTWVGKVNVLTKFQYFDMCQVFCESNFWSVLGIYMFVFSSTVDELSAYSSW